MQIFKKTLKEELILTLIFCIIISGFLFLIIQEFAIAKQIDFSIFMDKVPDILKGIAEKFLVLNIFGGYLHIIGSVHWTIFTSLFVCVIFSGLIAREVENKTLGLLLSYPITRFQVITEKYLASVVFLLVVIIFSFLGFYVGTFHGIIKVPYKVLRFLMVSINGFAFFLCLSSFSLFFSVIFNEYKKATIASLSFFFLSYLSFFLGSFSPRWDKIEKLTLFRFFDTEKLFMTNSFQWRNITSLLIITIIMFLISAYIFHKKDIKH